MEKKRIAYLDVLKCLAILMMVDIHIRSGNGFKPYETLSAQMIYAPLLPIFFLVSGFLSYKQSMTIKDFWNNIRRKFIFLVIPAIVFRIGMDLMYHNNLLRFLTEGMHGYWFTVVLFECFLIYYLITLAIKNEKLRIGALLVLSLAGIGMLAFDKDFGPAIFDLRRVTKFFQFFVLGTLAMKYRPKYESLMSSEVVKAVLLVSYFVVLFSLTYDMSPVLHHFLRDVALRYFATFAIVSFFVCHADSFQRETKTNSLLTYIGQNSLAIYLLHYFFLPKFQPLPEWFSGLNMVTVHLVSMLYTVAITALCLVFIKFLSNSKYIRKYVLGQK
ncbi:MAG: acyltransferase [Bacteroidaceae bacterium]|nr:acyltransferase [Bacteroidaceae bacterium]